MHTEDTKGYYIYRHDDCWYISYKIGMRGGAIMNTSKSPSVPKSGWNCDVGDKWIPDDNLSILAPTLSLCGAITITARGTAASRGPDAAIYLGTFHPSGQWACGRQVFRKGCNI